jgi:uncharacterized protein DUF955
MDEFSRDEVGVVVERLVGELVDLGGIVEPPVDAIVLARDFLGMDVCVDRRQPQRGRAQRSGGKARIYLRPEPTPERHQWTVAHEIGEHYKSRIIEGLGVEPEQVRAMAGESLANLFAYRLLVPTRFFAGDARALDYDLLQLKKKYATASHEVIAWRFLDLPEPCIVSIVDNDRLSRRRSNAWPVRRRLEPVEQECQRYVSRHSQPRRLRRDGWAVEAWPIHQGEWKREILRSAIEEEGS